MGTLDPVVALMLKYLNHADQGRELMAEGGSIERNHRH